MSACPSCGAPLKIGPEHHGTLYNCLKCTHVFFVGWEGTPQSSEVVLEEVPSPDGAGAFSEPLPPPPLQNFETDENPIAPAGTSDFPPVDMSQFENPSGETEMMPLNNFSEIAPVEPMPGFPPSFAGEGTEILPEFAVQDDEASAAISPVPSSDNSSQDYRGPAPLPPTPRGPNSDISDFGNAIEAKELSYDITIEGIETPELLQQLKDCLIDSRFGWDLQELLGRIQEGRLHLPSLNGPKAIVLYNRVKFLNLELTVRQGLFVAAEPPIEPSP